MINPETEITPEIITPFEKIFIADRGEMGFRILEACHKLNIGASVAVSLADVDSLAARRAIELGREDPRYSISIIGGPDPAQSYRNVVRLIEFAKARGCDGFHPGYGMIAEEPDCAKAIIEAGLNYIGPSPQAMEILGYKAKARELAQSLGIPVIPGSPLLKTFEEAEQEADEIGFPLMLKASKGGGGKDIRRIRTKEQLREGYVSLTTSPREVFIEKAWEKARHIEFQIVADKYGHAKVVGKARDCSVQQGLQKRIEDTPAADLPEEVEEAMKSDSIRLAMAAGYKGAGTMEFLFLPETGKYAFLESNTRIQVEHTITEQLTGIDLVKLQIRLAEGYQLPDLPATRNVYVRQYRIYAETETGAPVGGTVEVMDLPQIPGIRYDRAYVPGQKVPGIYDTTLVKVIVEGQTRQEVNELGDEVLSKMLITGLPTNINRLREINSRPGFRAGPVHTDFLDIQEPEEKRPGGIPKHIAEFIGGDPSNFEEFKMPVELDPEKLLYHSAYEKDGKQRIYAMEIKQAHEEHPGTCAFRFGEVKDDGFKYMLGFFDFDRFGGSMGAEEGNAIIAFLEEAARRKLPAVFIVYTGGARQQEGILALHQMASILAGLSNSDIPFIITWYHKFACGGVNASIAERANVKGAIGENSVIGLAGPDIVAKTMGFKDRKNLPPDTMTAQKLYTERLLDFVVATPDDARHKTLDMLASLKIPNSIDFTNPNFPTQTMRTFEAASTRFDQPPTRLFHTTFAHGLAGLPEIFRRVRPPVETAFDHPKSLSVSERINHIKNPYRPTPVDFMRPDVGIFQNVVPLFVSRASGPVLQIPVVSAYLADYRGIPVMVLAQQTQWKLDGGKLKKEYVPPSAKDIMVGLRMMDNAEKTGRHVILLGDTEGADVHLEKAAYQNISDFISQFIYKVIRSRVAVASINTGKGGSGGGLMHIVPADAAADLLFAHTEVAGTAVHHLINTRRWPTEEELIALQNQLLDGTAEGKLIMKQSDFTIPEPIIIDPHKIAQETIDGWKRFLDTFFLPAIQINPDERIKRRRDRYIEAGRFATVPI